MDASKVLPTQNSGRIELEQDPERYGRFAAAGLLRLTSSPLPVEFVDKPVRRDEQRFASPEMFARVWERAEAVVFDPRHAAVLSEILGETEEAVREQIEIIKGQTVDLIRRHEPKEGEVASDFFAPYNADPTTVEVLIGYEGGEEQGTAVYHDETHLGASRNMVLAKLATLSNFYGRLSRRPDVQKAFLKGIVDAGKTEDARAENIVLARAVATLGSLYMAKYPMKESDPRSHGDFYLAENNLGSLASNLSAIDQELVVLDRPKPLAAGEYPAGYLDQVSNVFGDEFREPETASRIYTVLDEAKAGEMAPDVVYNKLMDLKLGARKS